MKLHSSSPAAAHTFTGYGEGYVTVNGQRHEGSLIVLPGEVRPWSAARFDALSEADFAVFLELPVEVVVLGTGPKQRFPHPRLTRALLEKRIGVEAMDLQAACRTYNILVAEDRRVGAALVFQ